METKGCFWQVSDHILVKKAGISGNLEPKFYKKIMNLIQFLYFCGNGIPKLAWTDRREVLVQKM